MIRCAETAMNILNELHKERLNYHSEYLPLSDAIQKLGDYENTGLEPEEIVQGKWNVNCKNCKCLEQSFGKYYCGITGFVIPDASVEWFYCGFGEAYKKDDCDG